jgi:hypothetical protein
LFFCQVKPTGELETPDMSDEGGHGTTEDGTGAGDASTVMFGEVDHRRPFTSSIVHHPTTKFFA